MAFVPPSNENLAAGLNEGSRNRYRDFRRAAETVAEKNPYMDHSVYTRFLNDYLVAATQHQTQVNGMKARAQAAGVPLDMRRLQQETNLTQVNFMHNFQASLRPEEREPWQALAKEMQGDTIFGAATKQFYDSDKGGWQGGGLLGGAIGAGVALLATGGSGWLGIVAIVLGGLLGGWAGNKINNSMGGSNYTNVFPLGGPPGQNPAQGQAASQQITPAAAVAAQQVATPMASGGQPVDPSQGAQLPLQPTPPQQNQGVNQNR